MATQKNKQDADGQAQCSSCAHWIRLPPERDMEDDAGFCRRYPPVVLSDNGEPFTVFPLTDEDDQCGEYRARFNA